MNIIPRILFSCLYLLFQGLRTNRTNRFYITEIKIDLDEVRITYMDYDTIKITKDKLANIDISSKSIFAKFGGLYLCIITEGVKIEQFQIGKWTKSDIRDVLK